ncbi:MAG: isochorismatase hydrolase [Gammaproteobacteria bacterium]|nr:isochorismatase hydrolase [Gammaproteobacteria bacterium]
MHRIQISPDLLAQVRAQRGAAHIFDKLDIRRTAHLIVDLQNGFMQPGAPVEVPIAREIVASVNTISAAVRERGGQNIFLRMTIDQESQSSWSNWFAYMHSGASREAMAKAFARDAHYWGLWPELEVRGSDIAMDKTRFGAFVPGASRLHEVLQERGIDTLIITGTLTNCCCESTARDAMQMNYKIVFVADANAALTDAAHNATLDNMVMLFADVMTTQEVLASVSRAA